MKACSKECYIARLFSQHTKKITLLALLLINSTSYAVNPVLGWYGGAMLGVSYLPTTNFNFTSPLTGAATKGDLSYSFFGSIAGLVGYRCERYRIEGELLFNGNPYKQLKLGTVTFSSPKSSTGIRMKGQTSLGAFMVNGYYDFYTPGNNDSNFVPYLGGGLGYAYVKNNIKFYNNNIVVPGSNVSQSASTPALQGIIGASLFWDDFTAFSLDYRYLTTKSVQPLNSRVELSSINLTFSGAFDFG